jgi:hypothetical protein
MPISRLLYSFAMFAIAAGVGYELQSVTDPNPNIERPRGGRA